MKNQLHELAYFMTTSWKYLVSTLYDNFLVKTMIASFSFSAGIIMKSYEVVIGMMFVLFILDFILGFVCAYKKREIESKKLFGGAIKLFVYMVLIYIAFTIDQIFHTGTGFTWMMLAYIILRDAISILENLEFLGFDTPVGLTRFLKYRAENIFNNLDPEIDKPKKKKKK